MTQVSKLRVVEINNASGAYLGNTPENRGTLVRSSSALVGHPRELDDYHLCGLYSKAGVPHHIVPITLEDPLPPATVPYVRQSQLISQAVCSGLKKQEAVLVIGGTCVSAPGTAGGMRLAFGEDAKLGIIWLDAHGDMNIPETSPSGMLGGMPFATIMGLCLEDWRHSCGLIPPIAPSEAILSDARSFDPPEAENLAKIDLQVIKTKEFANTTFWQQQVQQLADRVDALYLHIDADIVDAQYLPSVNTPEPDGPDIWLLMENIQSVMATGKVALVNVASVFFDRESARKEKHRGTETAILSGIRMIGTILENWQQQTTPS
ncbi:MAG: arginase family protein [Symbiobacteriaceae bacterium]|nr:arginase family protein [Symbiobacteriaceae bacterium]